MSEKNIEEMTIDELITEAEKQHEIASSVKSKARNCESRVISKFLVENNLNGIVIHKPTRKKGYLRQNFDCRRIVVEFYPLKKNGEESMNKNWSCTVWRAYEGLKQNFENFLKVYEPVN